MLIAKRRSIPKEPISLIKRVQRGSITIPAGASSATATISAVTTANTRTRFNSYYNFSASITTPDKFCCTLELTNTTTVTATRGASHSTQAVIVPFTVVEFISGVISLMQRGTDTIANSSTSKATTISTASVTLTETAFLGSRCAYSSDGVLDSALVQLQQDSTTQITGARSGNSGATVFSYEAATYSSTYVDRAENIKKSMVTTNDYEYTEASAAYFDSDIVGSFGGNKTNTSNTDYGGDFAFTIPSSKGAFFKRGAFGPNGIDVSVNRIAFKPGYIRSKFIFDDLELAGSGNITDSLTFFNATGIQSLKTMTDYLGQINYGTHTKSSGVPNTVIAGILTTAATGVSALRFSNVVSSWVNVCGQVVEFY